MSELFHLKRLEFLHLKSYYGGDLNLEEIDVARSLRTLQIEGGSIGF